MNYSQYDGDGNLLMKTDARNITTSYQYDALNRLTGKSYSNSDPAVSYSHDQGGCLGQALCYNIGHTSLYFNLGTADNGNVASITNNRDGTRTQYFTCDVVDNI